VKETAALLGISPATANRYLAQAREWLRENQVV
jgi:DNA-directed RNA polymerase specialized sigma24 family protein